MLISLLLIFITACGGLAITYLIDDDSPLMWRLAAGGVIGSGIFGTVGFGLSLLFGLTVPVVLIALVIAASPVVLLRDGVRRKRFTLDWSRAKGRLQGANAEKFLRFGYYAFFFLLFFFFFDRAMLETPEGIFTGGSQNLGDLPFHLGAINSFTEINNFPPINPSYADARFSYPLIADLVAAFSVKLGATVRDVLFVQNLSLAFALLVILERFVLLLVNDKLAARIAPALLFFSGGLGFVVAFGDFTSQSKGIFDFLTHLPKDYTIGDGFRWGNSMVVLFMTQRSLLLGMPLTLIVLSWLWKRFAAAKDLAIEHTENPSISLRSFVSPIVIGLIAGMLPLIHLHSLAVLFVVGVFIFILEPERWQTWIAFGIGVAGIAVPELLWSMAGSASETSKFFAWHFGWDKGDMNFFVFWWQNAGLFIPILIAGLCLSLLWKSKEQASAKEKHKKTPVADTPKDAGEFDVHRHPLFFFYLAFAFLFVVSNVAKLAPWEWDNIKVLIYWFVGSIPLVALAIVWLWRREAVFFKLAAAVLFFVLIASGWLDVWRTVSGQIKYKVFDKDAVEVAEQIKGRTPRDARFVNAPTYNTAVILTGRQSLMRYIGHLNSHGIDYQQRESDVKQIYQGGPGADGLLKKYDISYVVVSPEERGAGTVNEQYFTRFPIAAEAGEYRVYKVKP